MGKSAAKCGLEWISTRDALDAQVRALMALAGALRGEDVDAVHDARVASRRLRAVLSEHKRLFVKDALDAAREKVRGITSGLGTARELDVSLGELAKLTSKMESDEKKAGRHATQFLKKRRAAESAKLAAAADTIGSPEFQEALRGLQPRAGKSRVCYFTAASRRALRRFDAVTAAADTWKESSAREHLHALRIAFKKLRYACEIYRGLYGAAMDVFVECLKDAQDSLGRWHDYSVLSQYVAEARAKARGETAKQYAAFSARIGSQADSLLDMFRRHAEVFFYPEQIGHFRLFLSGKVEDLQQEDGVCKCE
ncbi:MAG: CHAD domain-containing protein [Candidatus Hydrogenedentes bacterium]|nr:CHAD domain-containing protein [Candidatus Hydrogenedentota bacterium]